MTGPAWVVAVFFDRRRPFSAQFSDVVTNDVPNNWVLRATRTFTVVLISTVLVLETLKHYMHDATALFSVDAEAVECALV